MDSLDRVSRKYSLLINVDKTNVTASDGMECHILIQNELLEQVDTFPYLGSLITKDGECTTEFRTRLNRGQAIGASTLVGIIDVGVDACGILSRSVGQTNRK